MHKKSAEMEFCNTVTSPVCPWGTGGTAATSDPPGRDPSPPRMHRKELALSPMPPWPAEQVSWHVLIPLGHSV